MWRAKYVISPRRAAALGYRQLSRVRTADPSADGRRSAASQTAIGGGMLHSLTICRHNILLYLYAYELCTQLRLTTVFKE